MSAPRPQVRLVHATGQRGVDIWDVLLKPTNSTPPITLLTTLDWAAANDLTVSLQTALDAAYDAGVADAQTILSGRTVRHGGPDQEQSL